MTHRKLPQKLIKVTCIFSILFTIPIDFSQAMQVEPKLSQDISANNQQKTKTVTDRSLQATNHEDTLNSFSIFKPVNTYKLSTNSKANIYSKALQAEAKFTIQKQKTRSQTNQLQYGDLGTPTGRRRAGAGRNHINHSREIL